MTPKYRLNLELQKGQEFRIDDTLYRVPIGTKTVTFDVSESDLIERLKSVLNDTQFVLLSMERL